MTTIAAVADMHLGAGGNARLEAQREAWLEAVSIANQEASSLVIAGDAFHRARPTPDELSAFTDGLDALEIPALAIVGNHDVSNANETTALEVLMRRRDRRLVACRQPQTFETPELTIAVMPWSPLRPSSSDLLDVARALYAACPISKPSLLVLHWAISGATLPTGRRIDDVSREVAIPPGELEGIGFDAILAGHIHKPQTFGGDVGGAVGGYVGSLAAVDHSEAGDEHGLVLWHVEDGELEWRELTSGPRFVTADYETTLDLFDGELAGAIVRVRYEATPEENRRIESSAMIDRLTKAGASSVTIEPTIIRPENRRGAELESDVTPLEAVQAWLAEQAGIEPELAERMLAETSRYVDELKGES